MFQVFFLGGGAQPLKEEGRQTRGDPYLQLHVFGVEPGLESEWPTGGTNIQRAVDRQGEHVMEADKTWRQQTLAD